MDKHDVEDHITLTATRQNERWDSSGNVDNSYPYPDKFNFSEASGELADRIRRVFADGDARELERLEYATVELREKISYGGYSQYTQEHFKHLTVTCQEHSVEFDSTVNVLNELIEWLDAEDPVGVLSNEDLRSAIAYAKANGWEPTS